MICIRPFRISGTIETTLTLSRSAARLSFRTRILSARQKYLQGGVRFSYLRPVAFRPYLSRGLAFSKCLNDSMRLPSGISPREAKVGILKIGALHNSLEKGLSEPSWVGYVKNNSESELARSQEDSRWMSERLRIQWLRGRGVITSSDFQM
jgi:hypothetical protein